MPFRSDLGPKPRLGYTDSRIARAAELRPDATAIATLWQDPGAAAYVIAGDWIVMKKGSPLHDPLFTMAEAAAAFHRNRNNFSRAARRRAAFRPRLCTANGGSAEIARQLACDRPSFHRRAGPRGAGDILPPIAEAKAVLHWHARHRFCPTAAQHAPGAGAAGGATARNARPKHFPRTDPVVIMLASDGERCLLGRSPRFVPTMWSCLAGFIEPGESIEDAVHRETREEAGITCGRVRLFCVPAVAVPGVIDDRLPR